MSNFFTARKLQAPVAAFTMVFVLLAFVRTSITSARQNARAESIKRQPGIDAQTRRLGLD
ncbi:uncharacterized protein L969DRAFT_91084 [Mixia osmundae IAM 14324]|uniref:uncharacterized protein n=1 Tax=Mixia osmundae (strain CBS 9802 / IAM 14324 / JCM 22182 / KY 12970) TaxID=764103 RepID=UPI0004A54976|nr:uncharacterized protein L969DRAFT_91084 [Mixia osmundae IAM 14324]KEI36245.1 hypothetical protein L969DRAFT_91084 [Mixia osmundae IAM 14324]